jgi:hypothetical protein
MSVLAHRMLMAAARVSGPPAYSFKYLAALFSSGVDGMMIDLTDKTVLFQDPNGAASVLTNGDPVGLALDQHKWGGLSLAAYRAAQTELVSNGDFNANITGWSLANASNGALSWQAPGKLRTTANNTSTPGATQAIICAVGRWYEISVSIITAHAAYTGFAIGTSPGGGQTFGTGHLGNMPGLYRRFFRATATTQYVTLYGPNGGGSIAEFDNVSIKEIDGHHAMQTTAGSRPTWVSATNDVQFDGTNDYLTTNDFFFQDSGNALAAYCAFSASVANQSIFGMGAPAGNEHGYLHADAANLPLAVLGSTQINGAGSLVNASKTLHADHTSTNSQFFTDGVANGSLSLTGNLPDAARSFPAFIGARNNGGSPTGYSSARIKRIFAMRARVQDSMTAADFRQNMIAP